MNTPQAQLLIQLLTQGDIAALGTLHKGEPAVSMVPYALWPQTGDWVIHVSRLATHTQDLQRHASVSLMVVGERQPGTPAQAVPRVSLAATAEVCPPESDAHAVAKAAYLARFPKSEPMFGFGDFSLVLLAPRSVRVVGGFAQAWSLTGEQYRQLMASVG
jgi:putative heme iron utilization protein